MEPWRNQLTLIPPSETLAEISKRLECRQPGAYLRFGDGDVRLAAGVSDVLQVQSPRLTSEMQEAFALSGSNILKALLLECPGLGMSPGMNAGFLGMPDEQAEKMLFYAGRYFIGEPVYSHAALAYLSVFKPARVIEFLTLLKSCAPIFVGNEYISPDLVSWLFGYTGQVFTPNQDAYTASERIEADTRSALKRAPDYPVIVLAMGCAGRVLAKRLIKDGFSGFIFDFGSLIDALSSAETRDWIKRAPYDPRRILADKRLSIQYPQHRVQSNGSNRKDFAIRWEGSQFDYSSRALVNRELCIQLAQNQRVDLSIIPFWPHQFGTDADPRLDSIQKNINRSLSRPADLHIRNHAPSIYKPPPEGRLVVIQQWEFGSLPTEWVKEIRKHVSEVWVATRYVQDVYIESGIPANQVHVIPHGVNIATFRPDAQPISLATKKRFKFLFVGATMWRKGIDILLEAYTSTFTASDDVCLIIKEGGKLHFHEGLLKSLIARYQAMPNGAEIEYIASPTFTETKIAGLYTACDCLVHPYRGEGFGLPMAEAMACGLAVIVTGQGASSDFCSDETGFLIPARKLHWSKKRIDDLRTVDYPWHYEPDLDALKDLLRYVYEHPAEAAAKGQAASRYIQTDLTWEQAAQKAMTRVVALC